MDMMDVFGPLLLCLFLRLSLSLGFHTLPKFIQISSLVASKFSLHNNGQSGEIENKRTKFKQDLDARFTDLMPHSMYLYGTPDTSTTILENVSDLGKSLIDVNLPEITEQLFEMAIQKSLSPLFAEMAQAKQEL
jgi:hypothetical protein